jgi:hypothetical protein
MELLFLPFLLAIILGGTSRLIHTGNAAIWLNGFNTMSAGEQAAFDLTGYLKLQKRFMDGLALGLLLWGLIGALILSEFINLFPSLTTQYLRWSAPVTLYWTLGGLTWYTWTYRNRLPSPRGLRYLAPGVLLGALVLVSVLMWYGDRPSELNIQEDGLHISGMYGTDIAWKDILSVDTVAEVPPIRIKINGFADGYSAKGYFKTRSGHKVKLFVRHNEKPILCIRRQQGSGPGNQNCPVYYSNRAAFHYEQIIQSRPGLAPRP